MSETKYFLYEIRESDGNDCSVFDCIVDAESREKADEKIGKHFDGLATKNDWQDNDGWDYMFPCTCEATEEPEFPMECDDCQMLSINGTATHEIGCSTFAQYKRDLKEFDSFEDRECEHGGLTIDDYHVQEFDTEDEAENACARVHQRYTI